MKFEFDLLWMLVLGVLTSIFLVLGTQQIKPFAAQAILAVFLVFFNWQAWGSWYAGRRLARIIRS